MINSDEKWGLIMFGTLSSLATSLAALPQLLTGPTMPADLDSAWPANAPYEAQLKLSVSPVGTVLACRVVFAGGSPDLANRVCGWWKSARFTPAKGPDGAAAYGQIGVTFTHLVAEPPRRSADLELTLQHLPIGAPVHPMTQLILSVDANGMVKACDVAMSSGVPALDRAACASGPSAAVVKPMEDEKRNRVPSVQSLEVSFGAYEPLIFKRDGRYTQFGDPGPYFPERAERMGVTGYAIFTCTAQADGGLTDCVLAEEAPRGFGFEDAVLKMVQVKWMHAAPGAQRPVLIRVDFGKFKK